MKGTDIKRTLSALTAAIMTFSVLTGTAPGSIGLFEQLGITASANNDDTVETPIQQQIIDTNESEQGLENAPDDTALDGLALVSSAAQLKEAIANAEISNIKLSGSFIYDGEGLLVIERPVVLDLNGNTITLKRATKNGSDTDLPLAGNTLSGFIIAKDGGKLTVTSSSTKGTISTVDCDDLEGNNYAGYLFCTSGTEGRYNANGEKNEKIILGANIAVYAHGVIAESDSGFITVSGAELTSENVTAEPFIYGCGTNAGLYVSSGTLTGNNHGCISVQDNAKAFIDGGTIAGKGTASGFISGVVSATYGGKLYLSGGSIFNNSNEGGAVVCGYNNMVISEKDYGASYVEFCTNDTEITGDILMHNKKVTITNDEKGIPAEAAVAAAEGASYVTDLNWYEVKAVTADEPQTDNTENGSETEAEQPAYNEDTEECVPLQTKPTAHGKYCLLISLKNKNSEASQLETADSILGGVIRYDFEIAKEKRSLSFTIAKKSATDEDFADVIMTDNECSVKYKDTIRLTPVISADAQNGAVTYTYKKYGDEGGFEELKVSEDGIITSALNSGVYTIIAHIAESSTYASAESDEIILTVEKINVPKTFKIGTALENNTVVMPQNITVNTTEEPLWAIYTDDETPVQLLAGGTTNYTYNYTIRNTETNTSITGTSWDTVLRHGTNTYELNVIIRNDADCSYKGSLSAEFTVGKAEASAPVLAYSSADLVYDGTAADLLEKDVNLAGDDKYTDGTVWYAAVKSDDTPDAPTFGEGDFAQLTGNDDVTVNGQVWTRSMPKASSAGKWYVFSVVAADKDHFDIETPAIVSGGKSVLASFGSLAFKTKTADDKTEADCESIGSNLCLTSRYTAKTADAAEIDTVNISFVTLTGGDKDKYTRTAVADPSADTLTYTSSNGSVAEVNSDGTVTVKAAGETVITVKAEKAGYADAADSYKLVVEKSTTVEKGNITEVKEEGSGDNMKYVYEAPTGDNAAAPTAKFDMTAVNEVLDTENAQTNSNSIEINMGSTDSASKAEVSKDGKTVAMYDGGEVSISNGTKTASVKAVEGAEITVSNAEGVSQFDTLTLGFAANAGANAEATAVLNSGAANDDDKVSITVTKGNTLKVAADGITAVLENNTTHVRTFFNANVPNGSVRIPASANAKNGDLTLKALDLDVTKSADGKTQTVSMRPMGVNDAGEAVMQEHYSFGTGIRATMPMEEGIYTDETKDSLTIQYEKIEAPVGEGDPTVTYKYVEFAKDDQGNDIVSATGFAFDTTHASVWKIGVAESTLTGGDTESHGTIALSKSKAKKGDEITVAVTPASGYALSSLCYIITSADDAALAVKQYPITNNKFIMPGGDVTVYATFRRTGGGSSVDYTETVENGVIYHVYSFDNYAEAAGATSGTKNAVIASKAGGQNVTRIGSSAFNGNSALKSVSIPSSVTEIADYAFYNSAIESIDIPASVTKIGSSAFAYCSKLKTITVRNKSCTIPSGKTICNDVKSRKAVYTGTIIGIKNSTAQKYAEANDFTFNELDETAVTTAATTASLATTTTVTTTTAATAEVSPAAPTNVKVNNAGKVTWKKSKGAKNYSVAKIVDGKKVYGSKVSRNWYYMENIPNKDYSIYVVAFDKDGNTTASKTVKIKVTPVGTVTNTAANKNGKVTWTKATNAECYQVIKVANGMEYSGAIVTDTSYKLGSIPAGDYQIYVTAYGKNGASTKGEVIDVPVDNAIGYVNDVKVNDDGRITWGKAAGAKSYRVVKVTTGGKYYGKSTIATSYRFKNSSTKDYQIYVIAYGADKKQYTIGKTVTVPVSRVGVVFDAKIDRNGKVTWNKADNAVKYQVGKKVGNKVYYGAKVKGTSYTLGSIPTGDYKIFVIAFGKNGSKSRGRYITVKAA